MGTSVRDVNLIGQVAKLPLHTARLPFFSNIPEMSPDWLLSAYSSGVMSIRP